MNIGTERKVVLESFKEVPKEILFRSDVAGRDQIKKNRYWFDFPSQWTDRLDKDAIIGIRSMFVSRTNRNVAFKLKISMREEDESDEGYTEWAYYTFYMRKFLDGEETIREICSAWNTYYKNNLNRRESDALEGFVEPVWDRDMISMNYWFDDGKCTLSFGRPLDQSEDYTFTDANGVSHTCKLVFSYRPLTDDALLLIGGARGEQWNELKLELEWSRYQCYVTSSFSNDSLDNYLGHTRQDPYYPINYYRLSSDSKRFWIDLYETRDHAAGVSLPEDDKDVLYIEAVVCFSASGMI